MKTLPSEAFLKTCCRRIFFRNLRLRIKLGVYEHEKTSPQSVSFDCDVWTLLSTQTSSRDDVADVLDYNRIADILRSAANGWTGLQETLVDRLAGTVAELPGVVLVRLSSAKLEAYGDAEAVGVEIWRIGASAPEASDAAD